jgi:hypothetical protein
MITTIAKAIAILIARMIIEAIIRTRITTTMPVLGPSYSRLHIGSLGWTAAYA